MGARALATARAVGDRGADRGRRVGAVPRRDASPAQIEAAREHRAEARADRPAVATPSSRRASRRCSTSPGPRTTSSTSTRRSRTSTRGIAIARATGRRAAAGADDARQELRRSRCRAGWRRRSSAARRRSRRRGCRRARTSSIPRALRARLDALLRRRSRGRHRGARGERAGRPAARRRNDPEGRRRARLGAGRGAGSRPARSSAAARS